jgi:hypothetical protein
MLKEIFENYIEQLLYVGFFYYVNDNQEVNVKHANIMCHILCYNGMVNISNPRTQARNELISYYKTNGVTSLKNIWTKIMLLL